jgi:hypothetical protein
MAGALRARLQVGSNLCGAGAPDPRDWSKNLAADKKPGAVHPRVAAAIRGSRDRLAALISVCYTISPKSKNTQMLPGTGADHPSMNTSTLIPS